MEAYVIHILTRLSEFSFTVGFVAPFLGGEVSVLAVAFLAGQGTFSLWGIILGSFFGMLLLDIAWFLILRFPVLKRMKSWGKTSPKYQHIEARVQSFAHGNDVIVLLVSKMLIGTRILILAYLSLRKISFARFVFYDSIATFAWAVALGYLGFASGRGYINVIGSHDALIAQLLFLFVFAGLCYVFTLIFRKWILRT